MADTKSSLEAQIRAEIEAKLRKEAAEKVAEEMAKAQAAQKAAAEEAARKQKEEEIERQKAAARKADEEQRQAESAARLKAGLPPLPPKGMSPYYVAINGETIGPNNESQLRKMASEGQLTRDSLVWKEGMEDWMKASECYEFDSIFRIAPPPLPKIKKEAVKAEPIIVATDKSIKEIVKSEIERLGNNADLNHIDVSQVTDMSHLFDKSEFDGDISNWDVSNVTDMRGMFKESKFNGDISKWDVSNVRYMDNMFSGSSFRGDISKWDVSNCRSMSYMFENSRFSGDISKWDVARCSMSYMFANSVLKDKKRIPSWYKE